jgi:hypothetical protein
VSSNRQSADKRDRLEESLGVLFDRGRSQLAPGKGRDEMKLGAQLLREIDCFTSGLLRGLDPCDADDDSLVHGGLLERSAIILS